MNAADPDSKGCVSPSPATSFEEPVENNSLEMQSLLDSPCRPWHKEAKPWNGLGVLTSVGLLRRRQRERHILLTPQWVHTNRSVYPQNAVKNTKYNVVTFLPKVLFEQFSYFYNLYFLIVALSQAIPALQVGFLFTYIAPLGFVLCVTMMKELSDDLQRWNLDKKANGSTYDRLTPSGYEKVKSSQLRVGDIILVHADQRMPADCILLRTTEKAGACFIRTDQLDGETDWKLRHAVPSAQKLANDLELLQRQPGIYAEAAHKDIYSFLGTYTPRTAGRRGRDEAETEPLDLENTVWCNTVVATGTCTCAIIYSGPDTRSAQNASKPPSKSGLLEVEINRLSKFLCIFTILMALTLVAMTQFQGLWYINWFRFVLLFSYIVPVSLRVNLDMGKTAYTWKIHHDRNLPGVTVNNSNLPEELGRISYLFSDKTGTLTCNEMHFRRLYLSASLKFTDSSLMDITHSLKAHSWEPFTAEPNEASSSSAHGDATLPDASKLVSVPPPAMHDCMAKLDAAVAEAIMCIALCHNVTPVAAEDGGFEYQAASPDEVALVKFTESVGVTLIQRDIATMALQVPGGVVRFAILAIFPFTSASKRMAIVVRNLATGLITFFEKGADSVMQNIVKPSNWLEEECTNLAQEGLRTLVFGYKHLAEAEYTKFEAQLKAAKLATEGRAESIAAVQESLERLLELVGLTGVEDRLQPDVQRSLEELRNAAIKVWMLTGDKVETAVCIARSTRLVGRHQSIVHISGSSSEVLLEQFDEFAGSADSSDEGIALVMDGASLAVCLTEMPERFVEETNKCTSVVISRCSPTQKAEVVKLVSRHNPTKRVAAIGDGGNDVSMIQAAHCGLGIVGKEGKHAALAADFSMLQFSHCKSLILWHGRNSYLRSATLAHFIFHRGLIISFIQAVFSAIFYFSSLPIYTGWLMVGYTTWYTMLPVFSLVFDEDVTENLVLLFPELYSELQKGRALSMRVFLCWLWMAIYQGGAIMLLVVFLFARSFGQIISITFTALILTELYMVFLEMHSRRMAFFLIAELTSLGSYCLSIFLLPTYFDWDFMVTWQFAAKTAIITATACVPIHLARFLYRRLNPPAYAKIQGF
eukprot:GGOE01017847.1.p1 GENE.GGOE01017847.1~~GGOE01017847.1.p1  ORF type:complete len:1117 (-),score=406.00 GGOE01017847.1:373-3663(-)